MTILETLEGFVNCCSCPVLSICKFGNCGLCNRFSKYEAILLTDRQKDILNSLVLKMNILVSKCPLAALLAEKDCKAK